MKKVLHLALLAVILLGVPALCAWFGGADEIWEGVKSFPPRTEDWGFRPEKLWNHRCPFSWKGFAGMAIWTFCCMFPLVRRAFGKAGDEAERASDAPIAPRTGEGGAAEAGMSSASEGLSSAACVPEAGSHRRAFPWWGWFGLVELVIAWVFCWAKFDFCRAIQPHISYMPLWIGYILVVNGLCVLRVVVVGGVVLGEPRRYLLTFPVSSLFWWFFEYLNRYVWNWYYRGVSQMGAFEYAFYATLCFSSVLPAVTATAALLHTFAPFRDARFARMGWRPNVRSAGGALFFTAVSALGLCGIVFFPQYAFPLLWLSPLMAFLLVQVVLGEPCVLDRLRTGDWALVFRFSVAALCCGLAWETWNYYAVAKWVYSVPWVHRFQIWEMPVVGFAGYLPFGVECAAVTAWLKPELVDA